MSVADLKAKFDHEAWKTIGSTLVGYLLIIVVMTVVLFGLPWLIFSLL